jgi:glycosyltransferase involved in cell wall biosynthesis
MPSYSDPRDREPSKADKPLVSVVIPAYNAAAYIGATLRSVFAQTFQQFEILVVNDGSSDTPALERALQPYLSRIRYMKQENRGPSAARNVAIREAQGKYVAFLDSDDLWHPDHLANQVATLENDPSLGLVYSNGLHIVEDRPVSVTFDRTVQSEPVTFEALLREDCTVGTSSTVAVRQAILEAGLFDEGFRRCEDFDLWLRMAHNGVRMTFTRTVQIYHRLANGLAADTELMKRGRLAVLQKTASLANITDAHRRIIARKSSEIKFEIEAERTKELLLAGRFREARLAARQAASAGGSGKLRILQLGLWIWPTLLQRLYRSRLRRLEREKRVARSRSVQEVAGRANLDLESLKTSLMDHAKPTTLGAKAP